MGKLNILVLQFRRFDDYHSHAYFLSHCHTDHMIGLDHKALHRELNKKREVFVYGSSVTVKILKSMLPAVAAKLKSLPLEVPTLVPINDKFVTVTLVRAGHCPGSVMFLFEYEGKIILYTGDYRIHKNDIRKFKAFKYPSGEPKHINKIYLDTTFFHKNYPSFPSRKQCVKEVCNIIQEWTARSIYHIVHLVTSARYGYEYLLIEISKQLGLPIHVSQREYKFYHCIPEMDKAVTLSSNSTPLHNNCGRSYQLICKQQYDKSVIKTIRFLAVIWTENELAKNGGIANEHDCIKVCYSTHASLEEGQALIRALKPDSVEPCVVPKDAKKNVEMMELIANVIREYKIDAIGGESVCKATPKMFVIKDMQVQTSQSTCTEERCSLLESPPRIRRKKAEKRS